MKKEALKVVFEDEHIVKADIHIVRPSDDVRLVPVREAIEPRVKLNGDAYFQL